MIGARDILVEINTDGFEKRENFVNEIGKNQFIEKVSCLNNGKYFVKAICVKLEQLSQLQSLFNHMSSILSYDIYLLDNLISTKDTFTKLETQIIRTLNINPRMSISDVSKRIGRSIKGVRLAIKRLADTNSINFTIQPHIHFYCMKLLTHNSSRDKELQQRIRRELPYVWDVFQSTEGVVFITFFIEQISNITYIRRWVENQSVYRLDFESIGEPFRYYSNIRSKALYDMISES